MFRANTCLTKAHDDSIWSVACSGAGTVVSGGLDEAVAFWKASGSEEENGRSRVQVHTNSHALAVTSVTAAVDAEVFASCALDGSVCVYNAELEAEGGAVKSKVTKSLKVALSPDGKRLAGVGTLPSLSQLSVGDAEWKSDVALSMSTMASSLAYSPCGASIAVGGSGGNLSVVDSRSESESSKMDIHTGSLIRAVVYADDKNTLLSASDDGSVGVIDLRSSAAVASLRGHDSAVLGVAFSTFSANYIVSCSSDRTVKVFDRRTHEVMHSFDGHTDQVTGVAFRPATSELVSVSDDASMRFYTVADK